MHRKGFTLLELLIVIAILAVLATVAVLVINPLEYIKQSRDAKRIADVVAINKAIQLYDFNNVASSTATLPTTTVYLSLPDNASTTCGSYILPILPLGYKYNCVSTTNLQKTDGTGWIPLNFSAITGGSNIATLPIDPKNDAVTRNYYAFSAGGSYELTAAMESSRYRLGGDKDVVSKDGGNALALYEIGSNLTLNPLDYGDSFLAGYWKLDEGSGSTAYDSSGNKNSTWTGTQAGTMGYYSTGKVGSYGGYFNGIDDTITLPTDIVPVSQIRNTGVTYSAWIKPASIGLQKIVGQKGGVGYSDFCAGGVQIDASGKVNMVAYDDSGSYKYAIGATTLQAGNWYFITGVYDAVSKTIQTYVSGQADGAPVSITTFCRLVSNTTNTIGSHAYTPASYFSGMIDDVRIYGRSLTASEIQAMYNATK